MKHKLFLSSVFFLLVLVLATSCGSGRSFSSRKYMAGNYVTHKHKPGKPAVHEQQAQESAAVPDVPVETKITATKSGNEPVAGSKGISEPTVNALSSAMHAEKKPIAKKAGTMAEKALGFVGSRDAFLLKAERSVMASDGGKSVDPPALVSFILGVLGLGLNILALSVIIATAEYAIALLFIVGLVLGIMGLVFGTQGLRRHHKNDTGSLSLVFSIIGTACGGFAIISAFVFAIYTLIFAISGI